MQNVINYVKPELIVLSFALYFLGKFLKQTEQVKDKYIPAILGLAGIVLASLWVFANISVKGVQDLLLALFTSIVQGILVAGLSVYADQFKKQITKE